MSWCRIDSNFEKKKAEIVLKCEKTLKNDPRSDIGCVSLKVKAI